jgi:thymidylate synthase
MYILDAYDDALRQILDHGVERTNQRTGFRTKSIFGITSRYNLTNAFPIVTRRKVWPKAIWAELLWFISGSTCNKDLQALRSNIWTPWVDSEFEQRHGYAAGCFGPVYGFQLRHLGGNYGNGIGGDAYTIGNSVDNENAYGKGGFDQLAWMIDCIKEDPSSRRLLFMLWSPKDISRMKLPPCHYTYQVLIDDAGCMTGIMTQRSGDYYIGCCANVQFYSALTMMIAQQTGYTAYEFVHEVHDSHIYMNQIEAVEKYLSTPVIDSPVLKINKAKDIFSYTMDDFVLENYQHGPVISAPVAV